ncbi:helix-turn-helix domain-containing protein [Specibacter cremeus]|uniref:helix-turn-helix domain-containing protein n=1 Tax=Specibacter cremeus TaxID=1629051 RepID=UPI001F0C2EE5|nr:helix-turn-helix transcriptional regulator [Specibacter cremeus]
MLKFRNLSVAPTDPVEMWGVEGLLAAVERGDLHDWRRIAAALRQDPRGEVAADLEEVLGLVENPAMVNLFSDLMNRATAAREAEERRQVTSELRAALEASQLSRAEFAARLGTSQSRLSTYLNGKVVPSAVLLVRARSLGQSPALGAERKAANAQLGGGSTHVR